MVAQLAELPYQTDSARLFSHVQDQSWSVFLDSAWPQGLGGRYDIIAAEPFVTLETRGGATRVCGPNGPLLSRQEPFSLLRQTLGETADNAHDLPFCGGAIGYFAYDLGRAAAGLPERQQAELPLPDMAVGIYDWMVVVDHDRKRSLLLGAGRDPATGSRWEQLVRRFSKASDAHATPGISSATVQADMSEAHYFAAFRRIQEHIRRGDCYQVNLAQRFHLRCDDDPWLLYCGLRQHNPAPFSAFMRLHDAAILSLSPESFLQVRGDRVTTQPIKGTRARSASPRQDRALAQALQDSSKDRAENLMIVDLLRNDLSHSCIPGSVTVPQLYCLQSYSNVHHLVSTISGRLRRDQHALDLLRACFPGGSITGAPKRRAMQIIDALEPHARGVYCGSLAYIGFDGNMDSNIAIRTLVQYRNRLYCWGGGGIVSDSRAEEEYRECFDKLSAIMRFFAR